MRCGFNISNNEEFVSLDGQIVSQKYIKYIF
uniref:Uncharacterized protein n=1 Tax=Arundo donax TaxID=35708 RepID=A0A0A8YUT0_ARUDO